MTNIRFTHLSYIGLHHIEKFLAKEKDLWMAFVDLAKAFDRVPIKAGGVVGTQETGCG